MRAMSRSRPDQVPAAPSRSPGGTAAARPGATPTAGESAPGPVRAADASPLGERVRELLLETADLYAGRPWEAGLRRAAREADSPLRVALAGRMKTGKSTLLNALLGTRVSLADANGSTRVPVWYVWGSETRATAWRRGASGTSADLPLRRDGGVLRLDLEGLAWERVDRIEVSLPSPALERLTLVDTPGMASLTPRSGGRNEHFLTEPGAAAVSADAVLFLLRQVHPGDVDLLEAFRDPQARALPPIHALGVLSRADEIGAGRSDALSAARRTADRYAQDPRLRPLLQTVVPVAGLLAQAAGSLTAADHADLVAIAGTPPEALEPMLLSAIRFVAPRGGLPVDPARRRELVDRLGLFGLRLALSLLREGRVTSCEELAAGLSAASGMTELRRLLDARFTLRQHAIRADAALRLVLHVTAADTIPGSRRVALAAERLRLGIHDVAELRVLDDLRLESLPVPGETRGRMERVLGDRGADVRSRLGLPADVPTEEVRRAVLDEHAHWQRLAADLLTPPELQRAAAVLQRTCEGMRRDLRQGPDALPACP